jgi:hydrogenase large subunit
MSKRVVVDPITRIEGHLRIEADIENGKIKMLLVVEPWFDY